MRLDVSVVMAIGLIFGSTGCISKNEPSALVVEESTEVDEPASVDSRDNEDAASSGPFAGLYRVEYNFDRLRDQLVAAVSARRNDYSIFDYDLDYSLFSKSREGKWQRFGIARVADNNEISRLIEVSNPRSGRAVKHFFVGEPTASGYCNACFGGRSQIHFQVGVSAQLSNGQQAGFQTTAFKILRDGENAVRIIPNYRSSRGPASLAKVRSFSLDKQKLELVYETEAQAGSSAGAIFRLIVRLNRTLDTTMQLQKPGSSEFHTVAEFRGGALPKHSVQ